MKLCVHSPGEGRVEVVVIEEKGMDESEENGDEHTDDTDVYTKG